MTSSPGVDWPLLIKNKQTKNKQYWLTSLLEVCEDEKVDGKTNCSSLTMLKVKQTCERSDHKKFSARVFPGSAVSA